MESRTKYAIALIVMLAPVLAMGQRYIKPQRLNADSIYARKIVKIGGYYLTMLSGTSGKVLTANGSDTATWTSVSTLIDTTHFLHMEDLTIGNVIALQDSLNDRYRRKDTADVLLSRTRAGHDYEPIVGVGTTAQYYRGDKSWQTLPTYVSSQWTTTGSDIYYSAGKVGIGTSTPSASDSALQATSAHFTRDINVNGVKVGLGIGGLNSMNLVLGVTPLNGTGGTGNTALGHYTLLANSTGSSNTAIGYNSMRLNTSGYNNTAIGLSSLYKNTTGIFNVSIGPQALYNLTTNSYNVGVGYRTLCSTSTGGNSNTAIGNQALYAVNGYDNVAVGAKALFWGGGNNNIALGDSAGFNHNATGSDRMYLGAPDSTATGIYMDRTTGKHWARINGTLKVKTLPEATAGDSTVSETNGLFKKQYNYGYEAYGWGNHADEGYAYTSDTATYLLSQERAANSYILNETTLNGDLIYRDTTIRGTHFSPIHKGSLGQYLTVASTIGNGNIPTWDTPGTAIKQDTSSQPFKYSATGATIQRGSGNVGIGTTNPSKKLDITGTLASTGKTYLSTSDTTYISKIDITSGALHLVANASTGVINYRAYGFAPQFNYRRINGTYSTPTVTANNDVIFNINGGGYNGSAITGATVLIRGYADGAFSGSNYGSYLTIATTPNGSTTSAERLRITSAGNVGIGTTAPGYALEVAGQIYVSSAIKTGGDLYGNNLYKTSGNIGINAEDDLYLNCDYNNDDAGTRNIIFGSNSSAASNEIARMTDDGNLGIGTTAPQSKLTVTGGALRVAALTDSVKLNTPLVYMPNLHKDTTKATYQLLWNSSTGKVSAGIEPNHFYAYYSNNTGFTRAFVSSDTYYPIVTALTSPENHGFAVDNDSCIVSYDAGTIAGHCKHDISISFTGSNGNDIELQLYNVTDAAEVPTSQITTVTGAANRANIVLTCYDINITAGDIYQLRVKNISATGTITIYRIMWYGQIIHY